MGGGGGGGERGGRLIYNDETLKGTQLLQSTVCLNSHLQIVIQKSVPRNSNQGKLK